MVDVAQVQAHSRFFDHLVDLIPARFYHDEQEHLDMKSLKKAERLAAKEEFKQKAKENKRTKLDPDAAVTALEQQKRQHASTGAEEDGEEQQQQAGPSASLNVGQKLSREELLERLRQKIQAREARAVDCAWPHADAAQARRGLLGLPCRMLHAHACPV